MLQLVIELEDERLFVVDVEGKDAATVATVGATQVDRHREGLWTLKDARGRIVPPSDNVADHFKHGDHARLHLAERHARVTPAGSTHPDDQEPFAVRLQRLADEAEQQRLAEIQAAAHTTPTTAAPTGSEKRARGKNATRRTS
jgi:hypothetical protein